MSTDKSLKHLKSKDKFLITNVSKLFRETLEAGQLIIYSTDCSGSRGQQKNRYSSTKRTMRNWYTFVAATFETGTIQINLWTTLTRFLSETMCRSYTPTAISFRT